jgi:flavin reductase (DIM6/NTAB) family NADH-FMN oxidoreductase RutF
VTDEGRPIGGSRARDLRAAFPAGVVIVTGRAGDRLHGITVTSFCFAALDPASVLIALERPSRAAEVIAAGGVFAVNLPTWRQMFLADRFAGREAPVDARFGGVPHRIGGTGAPILTGVAAWLECRVTERWTAGDHALFLGEILDGEAAAGDPLIYLRRVYRRIDEGVE